MNTATPPNSGRRGPTRSATSPAATIATRLATRNPVNDQA